MLNDDKRWWGLFCDGFLDKVMHAWEQPTLFDFSWPIFGDVEYEIRELHISF